MERVSIEEFDLEEIEGAETFRLEIFSLFDDSPISLPCGVISNGGGKKVCILSGQHGNEWNGIYASQHFFKKINPEEINGTLLILPITNPLAYNEKSRVSSIDYTDLNRTFMKKTNTKPTQHLGKILFNKIFTKMDYNIDIHGGGPGEYSPHVALVNDDNIEKASKLLLPSIFIEHPDYGSLARASMEEEYTNFTIEMGHQRNLDENYVDMILNGLDNFLKSIQVLPGDSKDNNPNIYRNKEKISSPISGFFEPEVRLGDRIKEGEEIGKVEKIFGNENKVKSSCSGKILYLRREEVVGKGENLAHIVN